MMRAGLSFAVALGLVAAGATPAVAQRATEGADQNVRTGSRFTENKFKDSKGARPMMQFFGQCVARSRMDVVRAFLIDPSRANWDRIVDFPDNTTRCVDRDMSSDFRTMRGAISEGWYLAAYPDGPAPVIAAMTPSVPSADAAIARIVAADEKEKPDVIVDEFAACVVAVDPAGSDALLRSQINTDAEKAAIGALSPNFGKCAFEGQRLSFNVMGLRSAIAYALAARSLGPVGAGQAGGAA